MCSTNVHGRNIATSKDHGGKLYGDSHEHRILNGMKKTRQSRNAPDVLFYLRSRSRKFLRTRKPHDDFRCLQKEKTHFYACPGIPVKARCTRPSFHPSIPSTPFLVFPCITSSSFLTYSVYSCLVPLVTVAVRDLGARNSLLNSLLDVLDQIGGVFDTARDSDKVVKDTSDLALLLRDSGVSH
jgi:hypothetical protein